MTTSNAVYAVASEEVDQIAERLYAAARPLLAPLILGKRVVSVKDLSLLCEKPDKHTLTYAPSGLRIVSARLGGLRKGSVPVKLTVDRMPALRKFVNAGLMQLHGTYLVVTKWDEYLRLVRNSLIGTVLEFAVRCASEGKRFVYAVDLKSYIGVDYSELARILVVVRCLFPAIFELYNLEGRSLEDILGELVVQGRITIRKLDEIASFFSNYALLEVRLTPEMLPKEGQAYTKLTTATSRDNSWLVVSVANIHRKTSKVPAIKVGTALVHPSTLYRVPRLLEKVCFRDKIVADIGCSFGTKGAYAIKRGAKLVVYVDINREFFRYRKAATHTERIVADARMLPLRDKSVDIAILWNVVEFVPEKEAVLSETARITRERVLFSVYNAKTAVWGYDWRTFLKDCYKIGIPIIATRYRKYQYMAIVEVSRSQAKAVLHSRPSAESGVVLTGIHLLRLHYCMHCKIRAPRSTGVRLLEEVLRRLNIRPRLVLDYGCINWRNSKYLLTLYGAECIRVDVMTTSKPDVVAYPTRLPFRDKAFDVALLTHILMFLRDKQEMETCLDELKRVAALCVIECYHTKRVKCLEYTTEELENMITKRFTMLKRKVTPQQHECYVVKA